MGKATVVSHIGEGQYVVDLDYGKAIIDQRIAKIDAQIGNLEIDKTAAEAKIAAAGLVVDEKKTAIDVAIQNYKTAVAADPEAAKNTKEMTDAAEAGLVASKDLSIARLELNQIEFAREAAVKEKTTLQAVTTEERKSIWCANHTEDASGVVATVEVPGEPANIIMAPSGIPAIAADGHLLARAAMSPEQAFFNAAILPGWQRFKPTFRVGTISNINENSNTCTVTLRDIRSSAQGLGINQESVLSDVPVQYMTCNARAFDDGDQVLVRFDGPVWASPKVIGFESHPRPCVPTIYLRIKVELSQWAGSSGSVRVFDAIDYSTNCDVWVPSAVSSYGIDTQNVEMIAGHTYTTAPGETLEAGAVVEVGETVMYAIPQGVDLSVSKKAFNPDLPWRGEMGLISPTFLVQKQVWSSSEGTLFGVNSVCDPNGIEETALIIIGHTSYPPPGPATGSRTTEVIFESSDADDVAAWIADNCTLPSVSVTVGSVKVPYQMIGVVFDPEIANSWALKYSRVTP